MKLLFEQKKPGRKSQTIEPVEISIEGIPTTVGTLIEATVKTCVEAYNRKAVKAPDNPDADNSHKVLDQHTIDELIETGRISFGIVYNDKVVNEEEAVANALQCFEDGLFRMFLNGKPLKELSESIELKEDDLLTVVKLTMLAGRLW